MSRLTTLSLPTFLVPLALVLLGLLLGVLLLRAWRTRRWLTRRVTYVWFPGAAFDVSPPQVEAFAARVLDRASSRRVPAAARAVRVRVESREGGAAFVVSGPPQVEQMIRSPWPGVQAERR